jgi:hypothetical protein
MHQHIHQGNNSQVAGAIEEFVDKRQKHDPSLLDMGRDVPIAAATPKRATLFLDFRSPPRELVPS